MNLSFFTWDDNSEPAWSGSGPRARVFFTAPGAKRGITGSARRQYVSILAFFALFVVNAHAESASVQFSIGDRTLLSEYSLLGRDAPMIFALHPERTAAAAAALKTRGARLIGRRDAIGYLFAIVPIDAAAFALELDGLQAIQVAANPMRAEMDTSAGQALATAAKPKKRPRGTPPSPSLPADNPYTAEAATQTLDFKSRHPTFDGRGVVVGYVEGVSPSLATMRGALDESGQPLPKFARYDIGSPVTVADAVADGDNFWRRTEQVVPDARGVFTWRKQTYQLPADIEASQLAGKHWRICRRMRAPDETLERTLVAGRYGRYLSEPYYDVLWAVDLDKVWLLPASAGSDFSRARSTSLRQPAPWIAIGETADWRARPEMPRAFVFEVDRKQHWFGLATAGASHAGMVGSVMAGAGFLGSKANGVAPAAQIAIFNGADPDGAAGYSSIERTLTLLSDPNVDVAQASWHVGDTSRFDSETPHQLWLNRLIRKSGKPFIQAFGNHAAKLYGGPGFVMAEDAFAVGAYTPRETWRVNLGIATPTEHTLASYSGFGPAKDGGLKPDFLALTHTLSESSYNRYYWEDTPGFEEYGVSGGTSASAPQGAGNVALLVSAAKQTGIPHDAARLRAAIATSAMFLDGIQARAQGHGLIQVSDAWTALQRAKTWTPPRFTTKAPLVAPETKAGGAEKFVGRGLFELSGWRAGQTGWRTLTVTRTSGAPGDSHYRLRWKGDTQAFTTEQQAIELPLNQAVTIPVRIQVGAAGAYSAILDLVDAGVELVAGSILCTVMVADPLPTAGEGLQYKGSSPRLGNRVFYVDVPAGLSALTVKLTKDGSRTWLWAQDPAGRYAPFNPYGSETHKPYKSVEAREQQYVHPHPVPGVWQFWLLNSEPYTMDDLEEFEDWRQPASFDVRIQGWAADAVAGPASLVAAQAVEVGFQNRAGAFDASIQAVGLGSARTAEVTLKPGLETRYFEVIVDPGATTLEVQLDHAAVDAQVGLYVYKIPEGERVQRTLNEEDTALAYYDPSYQSNKRYTLANPVAGRYRIVLDPIQVPAQGLTVAYRDTMYHPLYGSVEVTDVPGLLQAGDTKTASVKVQVRARPADGRKLLAEVGLFNKVGPETEVAVATRRWVIAAE